MGVCCKVIYNTTIEEELNGLFRYPLFAPHGFKKEEMDMSEVPTPDGGQLLRVATPKVSTDETIAQCYHIFYDSTENLVNDIFAESTNGNGT